MAPIHNATSSAASIDSTFVRLHSAILKCKSAQNRGVQITCIEFAALAEFDWFIVEPCSLNSKCHILTNN